MFPFSVVKMSERYYYLCVFQVQATSPQEKEFVAASFGRGEDFTKQLEDFAVSKGMNKPSYSVVPQVAAGKLSYSCFLMVSTDFEKQRSNFLSCANQG